MKIQKNISKELQKIPGIGKSLSMDLWNLGIHTISDLKDRNPKEMYDVLCALTGSKQDMCVLYVFRCAVYFASEEFPELEKLKWWYWKDKKYNEDL